MAYNKNQTMITQEKVSDHVEAELRTLAHIVTDDNAEDSGPTNSKKIRKETTSPKKNIVKSKKGRKDPSWRANPKQFVLSEDLEATSSQYTSSSSLSYNTVDVQKEKAPVINISSRLSHSSASEISLLGSAVYQMEEVENTYDPPTNPSKLHRFDRNPGNNTLTEESDVKVLSLESNDSSPPEIGMQNIHAVTQDANVSSSEPGDHDSNDPLSKEKKKKIAEVAFAADLEIIGYIDQLAEEKYNMETKRIEFETKRIEFEKEVSERRRNIAKLTTKIKVLKAQRTMEINKIKYDDDN